MFDAEIYTNSGFDLRDLFISNTGVSTNEHFEGLMSASGSVLAGHQQATYSALEFEANGLTYRYVGEFTISADYGFLNATITTQGTYDRIEVLSGNTMVASYDGPSRAVDFGTQQVGVGELVGGLLTGVLALLFGSNAPSQAYANLHYDATPNLYELAFSGSGDIVGGAGSDTIQGGAGDDVVDGGAGDDMLIGGTGDDTYIVSDSGDQPQELADQGNDTVVTSVSFTLGSNIENVILTGSADLNATGNALGNNLFGNDGINTLDGGGGADVLTGYGGNDTYIVDNAGDRVVEAINGGNDRVNASVSYSLAAGQEVETLSTTNAAGVATINLTGNAFGQTIYGNAGANIINGGGGADLLYGYSGNDTYIVDSADDQVFEAVGGGTDRVASSVSFVLAAGQEVEALSTRLVSTTTAINLTGNAFAQAVQGNNGVNTLDGGGGADVLSGYGGNDTYIVDNAGVRVVEAIDGGNDRVNASVSYSLAAGQEIETLSTTNADGATAINLTGNAFGQTIYGNAGANIINGGGGADLLYGYSGNDTYIVDSADDQIFEAVGDGNDRVASSVSYVLAAGQEVETLSTRLVSTTTAINLTGNAFTQSVYGNDGANIINGGGGTDFLYGYKGNDTYIVDSADDKIFEASGGGIDRVASSVDYVLAAGQEVETLSTRLVSTTTAIDLTGNAFAQSVHGNDGVNTLDGGGGADVLTGHGGADTFLFATAPNAGNIDHIADFSVGIDRIELAGTVFSELTVGVLAETAFKNIGAGDGSVDADDRILYDRGSGALYYDSNGSAEGGRVQFATLDTRPMLIGADFVVA